MMNDNLGPYWNIKTLIEIYPFLFCAFYLVTAWPITLCFLQFFQQEEYDNKRFPRWWIKTLSFEKRTTLASLLLGITIFITAPRSYSQRRSDYYFIALLVIFAALALLAWSNRLRKSKKPLVMTARAKRIFGVSLALQLAIFALANSMAMQVLTIIMNLNSAHNPVHFLTCQIITYFLCLVLFLTIIPFFLMLANLVLSPYEARIQRHYLNEAKAILKKFQPKIIGITGSYGKTSAKHILAHILAAHEPVLATPGSVNTLMGITRIIRERLREEHRYFIVEMGAYGVGSIQKLCGLTPPDAAMVTAVGLAHWERFQSLENVALAKSELPRALPPDGAAILNGDDLQCRRMGEGLQTKVYYYGKEDSFGLLHCRLANVEIKDEGTSGRLEYEGKTYKFLIPIHGQHQALNAAGAFLAAASLGVPPLTAAAALNTIPPIPHRLVVQRGGDGITTIDDAYNSNPIGFQNALETLRALSANRKILVTPGMAELGSKHEEEHRKIAVLAAQVCNAVALVAPHRTAPLRLGLLQNRFPSENLFEFETLQQAREWLRHYLKPGDAVLFENDLPDLLEAQTAFTLM
ncbi:MAG: UDP-N-acetylmuramoyl-tripeptide--D-alanyl-D-alanine ligase [Candidatus Omnitrophota bacterium]